MNSKNYFIHRRGNLRHERAVLVSVAENGFGDWIDPQELVYRATGIWLGRQNCIASFATGLADSGDPVSILRQWGFKTQKHTPFFHSAHPTVLEYYLFGLAYSFGQMNEIMRQLRQFRIGSVHDVLVNTARFYHDQPVYMHGWERVELKF